MIKRLAAPLVGVLCVAALTVASAASANPGPVRLTGTFRAVHVDPPASSHATDHFEYWLAVGAKHYKLHFGHAPKFRSGAALTIAGSLKGHTVTVSTAQSSGTVAASSTNGSVTALVMLVQWAGAPADQITQANAASEITSQAASFYAADSRGAVSVSGTSTPWLTIANPGDPCTNYYTMTSEAEQAAIAAGYSPSSYAHELVYTTHSCSDAAGRGEIGGRNTWFFDRFTNREVFHELGHNFGLYHAHGYECSDSGGNHILLTASANCTSGEYDDPWDTMGGNPSFQLETHVAGTYQPTLRGSALFNASQNDQLGWMTGREQTATQTQTFTLAPYEQSAAGLQAVRVPLPNNRTYWLEYRTPSGWDSFMSNAPSSAGVYIHFTDATVEAGSELIDMTPGSNPACPACDMDDGALPVSRTWTNPAGTMQVTVNSETPSSASVTVTLTQKAAAPGLPSPSLKAGSNLSSTSPVTVPSTVSWTASTSTGICSYELQASANGGAFVDVYQGGSLQTAQNLTLGSTYLYRVRAIPCTGLPSDWAVAKHTQKPTVWDQTADGSWSGTWTSVTSSTAYGGSLRYVKAAGASTRLSFTASSIIWVGGVGSGYGSAKVLIDGVQVATPTAHSTNASSRRLIWKKAFSANGTHTIKLVNSATSGHPRIDADAFIGMVWTS